MRKRKKVIIAVAVIVVVAAAGGVFVYLKSAKTDSGPKGDAVRMENPRKGDLVESINAPAEVEPATKVAISARVMARIIEMPYEEGAQVTKGDPTADPPVPASVLVRLDSADLEASLRSAEARRAAQAAGIEAEKARIAAQQAELEGTKASLAQAELDSARVRELSKSGDSSQSELEQAQNSHSGLAARHAAAEYNLQASRMNLEVLQHNLEAAEAEISRARDALNYSVITSPIDGIVTRRYAKVGELVVTGTMNNPGTVILEVADLSQMVLVAQIDESDVGQARAGQKAVVRIHTYRDEKFTGTVESIALTHNLGPGGSKYFKTKILLDKTAHDIYAGLTADVDIETNTNKDVLTVPSQAVLGRPVDDLPLSVRDNNPCIDPKKTVAIVVYRFVDGKAVVTPVTIGPSDETRTVVTAGLSTEDRVIVGPYKVLENIKHDQNFQDEREVEKKKLEEEKKKEEGKKKDEDKKKEKVASTDSSAG